MSLSSEFWAIPTAKFFKKLYKAHTHLFPMKWDKWQEEVIKSDSKRILICKGRQIGGTTVFAAKAAKRLTEKKRDEIMVVSITEDQAQLVIIMVLSFLEKIAPKLISKKKQDTTKGKILLRNGSQIISRPVGQTGQSVRGFTKGVLWFNEASRLPEFVFEAAKPMLLTTNGDIWMDSTPFGKQGYFYDSFLNKNDIWTVFYKTSVDVMNEREICATWTEEQRKGALKLLEDERKEMTDLQFGQEYLGLFMEDLRRFYDDGWINRVCVLDETINYSKDGLNFSGFDLARMGGDYFTAETLKKIRERHIIQVDHFQRNMLKTTDNEDLIVSFTRKWNTKLSGIDAGSGTLGVSIYDHLQRVPDMKKRIIAMNNRSMSVNNEQGKQRLFQEDMHDNLRAMGERGEIQLFNNPEIKRSFESVQWELLEDSHGIKKIRIFGKNTHIVEGLIRAAYLANQKSLNLRIMYI